MYMYLFVDGEEEEEAAADGGSLTAFSQTSAIYSGSYSRFLIYFLPARDFTSLFYRAPGGDSGGVFLPCSWKVFRTFALWREKSTLNL